MTNPPPDILDSIEQLLGAGKRQEAMPLLVEYIKLNSSSAQAWWLLSLAVTEVDQQVDCLQRVIRLDPENESARERLAKLTSPLPVLPAVNPFAEPGPVEPVAKEELEVDGPSDPSWAARQEVPEPAPVQPSSGQAAVPAQPIPAEPVEAVASPRKKKSSLGLIFLLLIGLVVFAFAAYVGVLLIQRFINTPEQVQGNGLQETIAVAQTLTSLPFPTLIPTWTASPTAAFTPSPTQQFTSTRTPFPVDLTGPLEGFYAPDFSLADSLTGQQVTLGEYYGRPVLIFFWTTWCPNCVTAVDS